MKKEYLNGAPIPYDKPIGELRELLFSPNMKNFSLACEALSYSEDAQAYELLKSFSDHKDKYRRLYVIKTVFRLPQAVELVYLLENALCSDDLSFLKAALDVIAEHKIKISESILRTSVSKHINKLNYEIYSLDILEANEENYFYLTDIFAKSEDCFKKEILCEVLQENYLPERNEELFNLFKQDKYAKIRLEAIKLGKKCGFDVSEFLSDIDGHVRKFANRANVNLSFLSEYASKFMVDISDDIESAVIYNPFNGDNIYVEYVRDDEYDPFTVRFSYQHVHLPDESSTKEWIDKIICGELFAIEFFKDGRDCFGGEITREELDILSYESLMKRWGNTFSQNADEFRIRGWNTNSSSDFIFVKKSEKTDIEQKKL